MTLGELAGIPMRGQDSVLCYVCGARDDEGWATKPSENFTAWSSCFEGNGICSHCYGLLKTNCVRTRSWLLTQDGFVFQLPETARVLWNALLARPDGPWALYQTVGHQKHGWLSIANAVNESQRYWRVAVDWLDCAVSFTAAYVDEFAVVVRDLRQAGVRKDSLITGHWSVHDHMRAENAGLADQYHVAVTQAGNAPWEVLVNAYVADADV